MAHGGFVEKCYLFISAVEHPLAEAHIDSFNQKSEILPIDNAGGPSYWKPFYLS